MTIGIDASLARIFEAAGKSRRALTDPILCPPEYQADSLLVAVNDMVIALIRPVKGLGA